MVPKRGNMETSPNKVGSQLFLVRLWLDPDGADGASSASSASGASGASGDESLSGTWHGTVQHILTGKAASFHDRLALTELILEMMSAHSDGEPTPSENGATQ
jgi:hypothetical protein